MTKKASKKSSVIELSYKHPIHKILALTGDSPILLTRKLKDGTKKEVLFGNAAQAYLWHKSTHKEYREKIASAPIKTLFYWASERGMEKLGAEPIEDWDDKKEGIMQKVVEMKFEQCLAAQRVLISTGDATFKDPYFKESEPDYAEILSQIRKKYI